MTRRDALRLLSGLGAGAASTLLSRRTDGKDTAQLRPTEQVAISAPTPPLIVLKADDLCPDAASAVPPGWQTFATYILANNLKASLGLIGNSLAKPNEQFVAFLQRLHGSGQFELWNHGYDHVLNGELKQRVNGEDLCVRYEEFQNTCLEFQRRHLQNTQDLARARLAITITAFGAPGNAIDEVTTRVVDEAADIKVWFYGNVGSRKRVIPRHAEIEDPLGVPNFDRFARDYEQNSGRHVLALQCHPHSWTEANMKEFHRIIEFLKARHSSFVLPREL